jgi:hypothetical protein
MYAVLFMRTSLALKQVVRAHPFEYLRLLWIGYSKQGVSIRALEVESHLETSNHPQIFLSSVLLLLLLLLRLSFCTPTLHSIVHLKQSVMVGSTLLLGIWWPRDGRACRVVSPQTVFTPRSVGRSVDAEATGAHWMAVPDCRRDCWHSLQALRIVYARRSKLFIVRFSNAAASLIPFVFPSTCFLASFGPAPTGPLLLPGHCVWLLTFNRTGGSFRIRLYPTG